jgi:NAD(P)-dependent dehydrogenase (short-subunit alcohol dehydrogenase family)
MSDGIDPLFDLEGRIIVVTGGLGQLGRQFCETLLARGARVARLDRAVTQEGLAPDGSLHLRADVTSRASLESALFAVKKQWDVPDGLVNNAALDSPPNAPAEETGPFETYPEESWDRVMEVNAKGVFLCCQVFGGAMAVAGSGSVVNIASTYGLVSPDQRIYEYRAESGPPFTKPVAYAASKASLLNLTRYLATYWARKGVRVNTLSFGGVFNHQDERFLKGYEARVPLGRMAKANEYNGAIVFLLSGASSYMTGSNLVVDGGFTAW